MTISVIIPLYNGVEFLEECVNSVIGQTFTDWEIVIGVNGHGEDGGEVGRFAQNIATRDSRIIVHIQPPPLKGKVESSNDLVTKSKGEWICMLDCDDKWEPTKLERQYYASTTIAKNAAVIGTFCYYFGEKDGIVPVPAGMIGSTYLEKSNPIVNSSAMIKKEYCYWKYDDVSYTMEDYSLWMNISLQGKLLFNIPEYLTWHRIHKTSAFNAKGYSDVPLRTRYTQLYKQNLFRTLAYADTYQDTITRMNQFINLDKSSVITFIIPTTNKSTLSRTLLSILQQPKTNWKAIIVFYGCEPKDESLLALLQDKRFLYISIKRVETQEKVFPIYGQAGYVRNIGMQFVSNSLWVGFIDDGDTITPTYLQRLEDEENTTTYADAVSFKMKCGEDIFPPHHCTEITPHLIGISFVMKSSLLADGYVFKQSTIEDFALLHDLQRFKKTIVLSPFITYLVKDTVYHDDGSSYSPSARVVINAKQNECV